MVQETPERQLERTRKLAQFEAANASESRLRVLDENSATYRWLMASLFALNGGAIVSIFGKENAGLRPDWPAFLVFFFGVVSTFASAVFTQVSNRLSIRVLREWSLYWIAVEVNGDRDDAIENELKEADAQAERNGWKARLFALFGLAFFLAGVLWVVLLQQRSEIDRMERKVGGLEATLNEIEAQLDLLDSKAENMRTKPSKP